MSVVLTVGADPRDLIDGNAEAASRSAEEWRARGRVLEQAATDLMRVDASGVWEGDAASRLRDVVYRLASTIDAASTAHCRISGVLEDYADEVRVARLRAGTAVDQWTYAARASDIAQAEHRRAEARRQPGADVLPFVDPGEALRADALTVLAVARQCDESAAEAASASIRTISDEASEGTGFWDQVGGAWSDAWHSAADAGVEVGNGIMSFGQAMLDNPDLTAELIAGLLMMQGGSLMAEGGLALSATGVGSPGGIALGAAGVGVMAAGGTLAGGAALRLGEEATGDSRVEPLEGPSRGGGYRSPDAVPDDPPTSVKGYTKHSVERMVERDSLRHQVEDLIDNPKEPPQWQPNHQTWLFEGNGLKVAINEDGYVVSVMRID